MRIRGADISVGAAVAVVLLAGFVLVAVTAPLAAPLDPNEQDLFARLKPPGTEVRGALYVLGTDELGRDILSRIIHGSRVSLLVAFTSVCVSLVLGTAQGSFYVPSAVIETYPWIVPGLLAEDHEVGLTP